MNHLKQIAAKLPEYGIDAMLLNSEPGEFYAVGFHGEGNVVVTTEKCFYFTDSRYIEAANHLIQGAEIAMTDAGRNYRVMVQQVIDECRIQRLGFEVEDYGGNSLGLRAVPQVLGQAYLKDFFLEVLDSLEDYDVKARSRVERKLMSMACKAAVKGGDPLSLEELHTLLAAISQEDTPLSCPHGRPILVSLSRRQLEKQFKRVL